MTKNTQQTAHSEALKRYHASRTSEQRAETRKRISAGTTAGMHAWHARRDPAEREQARERIRDAALCRTFMASLPRHRFAKGHPPLTTPNAPAMRSLTRVQTASIRRILKDLVHEQPDMVRDAIIEGLQAAPPKSFPYIALAAAYLDGKPINAEPAADNRDGLSNLTGDQLVARAMAIAARLRHDEQVRCQSTLPVIDVDPVRAEEGES